MPRSTTLHVLAAALMLTALAATIGQAAQSANRVQEAKLIAVVTSNASRKEKADACQLLARIATRKAVAPLAPLLADKELSHMIRYAIETIPDPSVDEAFRDALGHLKGRPLVGVIGSIGVRRDVKAVDLLTRFLGDADADVAQAAARSLGKIGTSSAAKALTAALPKTPHANQVAFYEGLFRCAETLSASGKQDEALAIYDRLRGTTKAPHQVRAGGLRGAILVRGKQGLPLLVEAVRGDDHILVAAAARAAMEMSGTEVAQALAGELGKLAGDKKILIIQTLGNLGDAAAMPALSAAAKTGEKSVRVAAIRALPMIGDAAAAPLLLKLMSDADAEVAQAAQENLAALSGPKADAAVAAMLKSPDAETRRVAVELLGRRRVAGAVADLLKAAEDSDQSVRVASLKVLGGLAGTDELQAMIGLLMKAKSPEEAGVAETALAATCMRGARPVVGNVVIRKAVYGDLAGGAVKDVTKKVAAIVKAGTLTVDASNTNFGDPAQGTPKKLRVEYTVEGTTHVQTINENDTLTIRAAVASPACAAALCAALAKAPVQPKLALLRVLRSVGGAKALGAVRAAAKESNAEVRGTALRALCAWKTVAALPDVARLARTSTDATIKVLALRGWMRLIPMQNVPAAQKLASLKAAMGQAKRNQEKKVALAALGSIPLLEALNLVMQDLDTKGLTEEASMAAVGIAEKIVGRHPAEVNKAMQQVVKATANKLVARRGRKLLQQTKPAR